MRNEWRRLRVTVTVAGGGGGPAQRNPESIRRASYLFSLLFEVAIAFDRLTLRLIDRWLSSQGVP